jgi:hypothetical protein
MLTSSKTTAIEVVWPMRGEPLDPQTPIVIDASAQLDATLLEAGTITLRGSGGDNDFTNGNETELAARARTRSSAPTVLAIEPADGWQPDTYELRISGSAPLAAADIASVPIDGDADGTPGGDFVLQFTVEEMSR